MKSLSLITFSFLTIALVNAAKGYEADIGSIELAGTSCVAGTGAHEIEYSEKKQSFILPSALYLKKDESSGFSRGTCNFAFSLKASPGKILKVAHRSQFLSMRVYPQNTEAQLNLEIFKAGERSPIETQNLTATNQTERLNTFLDKEESLLETSCGGSALIRGNFSAVAKGSGKVRIFLDDLQLKIIETDCQNQ